MARFGLKGGYEAQYWPGLNQLTRFAQVNLRQAIDVPFSGDLGFHGWTLGARFDF